MRLRLPVVLFLLVATAACFDESACFTQNQVGGPTPVATPTPTPTPSPSGSPQATVACTEWSVFRSSFGWDGPAGSVRPNNQQQPYPLCVGCESVMTATLKTPQGDAPLTVSSGKGRPAWTVTPLGVLNIDASNAATNNPDGYNLKVTPLGNVGATATVHVVLNALCVGEPPSADFDYVITAS